MPTKTCKKVIYDNLYLAANLLLWTWTMKPMKALQAFCLKSTDKWEEEEAQLERRRNRRRKQSAEAAAELARQRRSDLRRWKAEAELAMSAPRRGREEHAEPESYQEPGK